MRTTSFGSPPAAREQRRASVSIPSRSMPSGRATYFTGASHVRPASQRSSAKPKILLYDEATTGLDPITAAEIAKLIVELRDQRHITSIVVTHDLHTARAIADRLIVLDAGKTLFDGTFEGLQQSANPFIVQFMKDAA